MEAAISTIRALGSEVLLLESTLATAKTAAHAMPPGDWLQIFLITPAMNSVSAAVMAVKFRHQHAPSVLMFVWTASTCAQENDRYVHTYILYDLPSCSGIF